MLKESMNLGNLNLVKNKNMDKMKKDIAIIRHFAVMRLAEVDVMFNLTRDISDYVRGSKVASARRLHCIGYKIRQRIINS